MLLRAKLDNFAVAPQLPALVLLDMSYTQLELLAVGLDISLGFT